MAKATPITPDSSPHKAFVRAAITKDVNPDGPVDVVATVTTDCVDADREVVLPGGVDLSRYLSAPRIQLCHATGSRPGEYYVLPIGRAVWTRRIDNSLVQGIEFAKTPMGQEVAELFRSGMLNTFSIGFVSLEASPPTKAEKLARPDWAKAELVHRRWQLLEVSVVPLPCNSEAIGEWVRKGKVLPSFVWTNPIGLSPVTNKGSIMAQDADETTPESAAESETAEPTETPTVETPVETPAEPTTKAMDESSGTAGGYTVTGKDDDADDEMKDGTAIVPEATHNPAPTSTGEPSNYEVKSGHFIKWDAHDGMHGGCGKCMSVHKAGRVPDVANDADASEEMPHARVKLYKSKGGDSHVFAKTEHHVAVACKHCKRMPMVDGLDEEKTTAPPVTKTDKPAAATPTEPPFTPPPFRTKTQYLASLERKVREQGSFSPPADEIAQQALATLLGAV
jgi:hypothetical protein